MDTAQKENSWDRSSTTCWKVESCLPEWAISSCGVCTFLQLLPAHSAEKAAQCTTNFSWMRLLSSARLPFSHREARELLCAADSTWRAWFTALLWGRVIGYANHLRSHTLNLYKVPECMQAVLFSLRKNCFASCWLCPLLEAGFVTPLLRG